LSDTTLLRASFKSQQHLLKKKSQNYFKYPEEATPELGLFRNTEWHYKLSLPFLYEKDYEKGISF